MQEGVVRSTTLAFIAAAAIFFVIAVGLAADNYPTRPIILVIPLPPGGRERGGQLVAKPVARHREDVEVRLADGGLEVLARPAADGR